MSLDLTGITLPFSAADLLSSSNAIMTLVGGFILLGLAIRFAPNLFGLIGKAISAVGGRR